MRFASPYGLIGPSAKSSLISPSATAYTVALDENTNLFTLYFFMVSRRVR